jgi:hypothetical protein
MELMFLQLTSVYSCYAIEFSLVIFLPRVLAVTVTPRNVMHG